MRIVVVGKYPPIQGGVSGQTYWLTRALAQQGHSVTIVTNAPEVEASFRQVHFGDDASWLDVENLRVRVTSPLDSESYIPWAQPYSSKLLGLCLDVVRETRPDVIIGSYFEPYGVVATIVGKASGIPVFIRHAGSDVARLARHPNLNSVYRWMLENASGPISPNIPEVQATCGPVERPPIRMPRPRLPDVFFERPTAFALREALSFAGPWFAALRESHGVTAWLTNQSTRELDPEAVTFGMLGKVGAVKGSFAILSAMESLAAEGVRFNFVCLAGGRAATLTQFLSRIADSPTLSERCWVLPPLTPWRVPAFLAACDAVAFLEHRFSVKFHGPSIPREVLAMGSCLLVSQEIASNPDGRCGLVDERNAIVCADPTNLADLRGLLKRLAESTGLSRTIGRQGKALSNAWESWMPTYSACAAALVEQVGLRI